MPLNLSPPLKNLFESLPFEMHEEIASHCSYKDLGKLRCLSKQNYEIFTPLYQKQLYPYENKNPASFNIPKITIPIKKYLITRYNWYETKFDPKCIQNQLYDIRREISTSTEYNWSIEQLESFIKNNPQTINYLINGINVSFKDVEKKYVDILKYKICPYDICSNYMRLEKFLGAISKEKIVELTPYLKNLEHICLMHEFFYLNSEKSQAFFNALINSGAKPTFFVEGGIEYIITSLNPNQLHILASTMSKRNDFYSESYGNYGNVHWENISYGDVHWGNISNEKRDIIISMLVEAKVQLTNISYLYALNNQQIKALSPCLKNLDEFPHFYYLPLDKTIEFINAIIDNKIKFNKINDDMYARVVEDMPQEQINKFKAYLSTMGISK